jgi:hypothetical protein
MSQIMRDFIRHLVFRLAPSFALAVSGFAQGTIRFNNYVPASGVDAPVFANCWSGTRAWGGEGYVAMLLGGPVGDPLVPVSLPVGLRNGVAGGYFSGGTVTITNIPPGGPAEVQIVAWNSARDGDYSSALATSRIGFSNLLKLQKTADPTATPPGQPVDLVGLQSFGVDDHTLDVPPCRSELTLVRSNAVVLLRWNNAFTTYHLLEATNLTTQDWQLSTHSPTTNYYFPAVGLYYFEVSIPADHGQRFFRLLSP